ncbi:MAG: hypothetical protein R3F46_05460 [bacterium]
MNEVDKKWGAIALFDALGARGYSIEDSINFLNSREELIENSGGHIQKTKVRTLVPESELARIGTISGGVKVQAFTFGDTIGFAITGFKKDHPQKQLAACEVAGNFCRKFFTNALLKGILFRGAFSIGEFVTDYQSTIIGPAVRDAAEWYESCDWIGVVASPNAGKHVSLFFSDHASYMMDNSVHEVFLEYDVPLKRGGKAKLVTLNWPRMIDSSPPTYIKNFEWENRLGIFQTILLPHNIDFGTEKKYENTIEFYRSALSGN